MKKTPFILFAVLLLLVACKNEKVTEEDTSEEQEVSTVEVDETAEETTIDEPVEEPLDETTVGEPVEESEVNIEQSETVEQEKLTTSADDIKEIIYSFIGADDTLGDFSFENGQIKTTIDIVSDGMFPIEDLAVNRYSQLSDELLYYDGWEILTVTFTNVGTISMNRNEAETNEFGEYFPTLKIEERLNY